MHCAGQKCHSCAVEAVAAVGLGNTGSFAGPTENPSRSDHWSAVLAATATVAPRVPAAEQLATDRQWHEEEAS